MAQSTPVQLFLAMPAGEEYLIHVRVAQTFPDVVLLSMCPAAEMLGQFLADAKPEVCIIDAGFIFSLGFDGFEGVHRRSMDTVYVVLMDKEQSGERDRVSTLPGVREVLLRPVNVQAVIQRAADIGRQRREQIEEMAPLTLEEMGPRARPVAPVAIAQQQVIAINSWAGGTGKTTLAVTMWKILNEIGFKCLLIGFCRPDPLRHLLGRRDLEDMLLYMRDPSLEGFRSSIQMFGDWPVILAPRQEVQAEGALVERSDILVDLVYQATRSFQVILLDLPVAKEPWSLDPIRRATMVVTVLTPTRVHVNQTIYGTRDLLTLAPGDKALIERENIYTVVNMARPGDDVNPAWLARAFASGFGQEVFQGWCPANLGVIRFDPTLRALQNYYDGDRVIPVMLPERGNPSRGGAFYEGAYAVIRNIFRDVPLPGLGEQGDRKRRGFFSGLFSRE
jgi:Mrp family chromosome partitioning ATPase